MEYVYKSQPFAHQDLCFMRSRDEEYFGILFEMGAGKSKVLIDTAAYLYGKGRINCLVVLAPNGVHKKWVAEDIPFSMPDYIDTRIAVWEAGNKKSMQECEDLFEPGECLRILCANVEGMSYSVLPKFLKRLLNATTALVGVDESTRIKNPSAKMTKSLLDLKKFIKYRRILAGDAVVNSPFDLFSQFGFLDEEILGYSYPAFKAEHAEMLKPNDPMIIAVMQKNKLRYPPQIAAKNPDGSTKYRNLERLKERIAPYCTVIKKSECLDLPPKIYEKRYYKMEGEHRKMYDSLVENSRYELNNTTVPVLHKLTLLLRLQQMISGYAVDAEGTLVKLFSNKENPRVQALLDTLEDVDGQVIIWCRFQEEIRTLNEVLGPENCAMYYGEVEGKLRQENMNEFKSGKKKYLLGTAQSGGIGLNLTAAATAIYYSNTFNAGQRWQSEDRCHRIGQTADKVLYIDIEAVDTIDAKIIAALRSKKDLSEYMLNLEGISQTIV